MKVGDIIIATSKTNEHYVLTNQHNKYIGKVVQKLSGGNIWAETLYSKDTYDIGHRWEVHSCHFITLKEAIEEILKC